MRPRAPRYKNETTQQRVRVPWGLTQATQVNRRAHTLADVHTHVWACNYWARATATGNWGALLRRAEEELAVCATACTWQWPSYSGRIESLHPRQGPSHELGPTCSFQMLHLCMCAFVSTQSPQMSWNEGHHLLHGHISWAFISHNRHAGPHTLPPQTDDKAGGIHASLCGDFYGGLKIWQSSRHVRMAGHNSIHSILSGHCLFLDALWFLALAGPDARESRGQTYSENTHSIFVYS